MKYIKTKLSQLKYYLLYQLSYIPIVDLAVKIKNLQFEILTTSNEIDRQLFYLMLYPQSAKKEQKINKIVDRLYILGKTKLDYKNRKMDYELYYDSFADDFNDDIIIHRMRNHLSFLLDDFEEIDINISDEDIIKIIERFKVFYHNLSKYFYENKYYIYKNEIKDLILQI
jgi:hypothetical protein